MMHNDEYYMRIAIEQANLGIDNYEYPFGCCLVVGEEIITAHNTCFSSDHVLQHAEINAINQMTEKLGSSKLKDAVIYTTTEPCVMCMGAINWAKIPRLVYGTSIIDSADTGFAEVNLGTAHLSKYFTYQIEIRSGVLEEECKELFKNWKIRNSKFNDLLKRFKK